MAHLPTPPPTGIAVSAVAVGLALYGVRSMATWMLEGRMVGLLTVVGLTTSAFFFIGRDVYATLLFHHLLGLFGVVQALASSGRLNALMALQAPLLVMAVAAIGSLAVPDLILLRRRR